MTNSYRKRAKPYLTLLQTALDEFKVEVSQDEQYSYDSVRRAYLRFNAELSHCIYELDKLHLREIGLPRDTEVVILDHCNDERVCADCRCIGKVGKVYNYDHYLDEVGVLYPARVVGDDVTELTECSFPPDRLRRRATRMKIPMQELVKGDESE